jgi:hypothetical protein
VTSLLGFVCLMPAPSTFDDVVQLRKACAFHPIPVQFGARRSGDPAVIVAASDKIRRFELPLPLGSAVGAASDVVRYRTLSSQENIWDTEQREQ